MSSFTVLHQLDMFKFDIFKLCRLPPVLAIKCTVTHKYELRKYLACHRSEFVERLNTITVFSKFQSIQTK